VHLHYAPRWPDAEHLDARLQWTGNALTVRSHGDISGIPVREAQVSIGNLDTALASPLYAEINTPLPMAKLLPYLRQTPILSQAQTLPLQLSGEGQLHLALKCPFIMKKPGTGCACFAKKPE
jgi:Predicted membrane protein